MALLFYLGLKLFSFNVFLVPLQLWSMLMGTKFVVAPSFLRRPLHFRTTLIWNTYSLGIKNYSSICLCQKIKNPWLKVAMQNTSKII